MAQRKVLLKRDGVTIIHLSKMSVMNMTLLYPPLSGPLKTKAKNMILNGRYQKKQPLTSVEEDRAIFVWKKNFTSWGGTKIWLTQKVSWSQSADTRTNFLWRNLRMANWRKWWNDVIITIQLVSRKSSSPNDSSFFAYFIWKSYKTWNSL